jgi:hypothetical protein
MVENKNKTLFVSAITIWKTYIIYIAAINFINLVMSDDSKNALVTWSGMRLIHGSTHYSRYALQSSTLPRQVWYKIKPRTPIANVPAVDTPYPTWTMTALPSTSRNTGYKKTRSNSEQITCSMFGLNQQDKYPGFVRAVICGIHLVRLYPRALKKQIHFQVSSKPSAICISLLKYEFVITGYCAVCYLIWNKWDKLNH